MKPNKMTKEKELVNDYLLSRSILRKFAFELDTYLGLFMVDMGLSYIEKVESTTSGDTVYLMQKTFTLHTISTVVSNTPRHTRLNKDQIKGFVDALILYLETREKYSTALRES